MGRSNSHRKISTGCVILIAICTIGLHAILVAATKSSENIEPKSLESIEDGIDKISDDLQKSESKDGKVEIIKQIQKVNTDGSYTVGYEAEDGTFKIESRDVLGNVKGTFGYIDVNGEIKRVSYTANNGTGLKNTQPSSEENEEAPSRFNRTLVASSTTRRPVYASSTISPTRGTVIQPIPRRYRILSASPLGGSSSTEKSNFRDYNPTPTAKQIRNGDPTTTVVYATSVPTSKPYINIRPTPLPGTNLRQASEQQISRPEKLEINNHHSQVQISSNRDTSSTTKPVVEDIDEKDEEKIILRAGNSLRRELQPDSFVSQDDRPLTSASRPIYSTTTNPKIPTLVLKARQRALQIQNSLNGHSENNEKYYIRAAQKKIVDTSDEPTTESTSEHSYLTQNPIQDQIPPNRMIHKNDIENRVLRKSEQRIPQFVRVHPHRATMPQLVRLPIPQQINENEQYLRETTPLPSKSEQIAEQDPVSVQIPQQQPIYNRNSPFPPSGYYANQQQEQMSGYYPQSSPPHFPYRDHPGPFAAPYYGEPNGYQERPLTTRDFERLLHLLILRHQYLQRSNPYLPYDPYYNGGYQQQYSRPLPSQFYNPYDVRPPFRPAPYYPTSENMYQAQNPIPQSEINPMEYELQRLMPRKKPYNPRYYIPQNREEYAPSAPQSNQVTNYLPPDVREELLYRMLMLALQSEPQASATAAPSKQSLDSDLNMTTKPPNLVFRKPVRSVQILGEENELIQN